MATAKKHMERSHRSHHNPKPFAYFASKSMYKVAQGTKRKTIIEMIESLFQRTTNK